MIATYNQVKSEMRTKEAEFAHELRRAKYSEGKALNRLGQLVARVRGNRGRKAGRTI